MSTSKARNNKLAVKLATDNRYKFQKNGAVKKLGSDGKFREVGTTRHGYNVVSYNGKKVVVARAAYAKKLLELGYDKAQITGFLSARSIFRTNGVSLDDSAKNLSGIPTSRESTKRLSRKQIDRMVELFCEGYSVAKIARRFRRRISRSHISSVIKRELGMEG